MRYIPLAASLGLAIATVALAAPPQSNAQKGRQVFVQCASCHSMDGAAGVGPSLRGVYGRKAGSVAGYRYSPAMKGAGMIWNDATLDAFLRTPERAVPHNRMPYAGLPSEQDRRDIVAYLKAAKS